MTWALAELSQLFAASYSVRSSLKKLKRLSLKGAPTEDQASSLDEVLMFWVIFGVYMVFEQHFEFMVRWIPGYYYAKASFILVVAFPQLNFTKMVFHKGIVPFIETSKHHLEVEGGLRAVVIDFPFLVAGLMFPFLTGFITEDEVEEEDAAAVEIPVEDISLSPTLPPPPSPTRSVFSVDHIVSPPISPPILSSTVQIKLRESSRRLSSLVALNRQSSPRTPPKPALTPSPSSSSSSSSSGGKENLPTPSRRSGGTNPRLTTPTSANVGRGPGGGSKKSLAASPESRNLLSPLSSLGTLGSMFSLDLHSPPVNSIDRDRRRTLMAGGIGRRGPLSAEMHNPGRLSLDSKPKLSPLASSKVTLPPLEGAIASGNVSMGRRGSHLR